MHLILIPHPHFVLYLMMILAHELKLQIARVIFHRLCRVCGYLLIQLDHDTTIKSPIQNNEEHR